MKALGRSVLAATLVSAIGVVPTLVSGANPAPPVKAPVATKHRCDDARCRLPAPGHCRQVGRAARLQGQGGRRHLLHGSRLPDLESVSERLGRPRQPLREARRAGRRHSVERRHDAGPCGRACPRIQGWRSRSYLIRVSGLRISSAQNELPKSSCSTAIGPSVTTATWTIVTATPSNATCRNGMTWKRLSKNCSPDKPVTLAETTPRGCLITHDERPASLAKVTYASDISRILQRRCQECHRAGEVAPFTLQSYDDAVEHSAMMKEVVLQRPDAPLACRSALWPFLERPPYGTGRDRSASGVDRHRHADRATRRTCPLRETWTAGWQIGKPDFVFELPLEVKVPATGTVAYHVFLGADAPERRHLDSGGRSSPGQPGRRSPHHRLLPQPERR